MIRTEATFDCLASAQDEVLAISMQNAEQIHWRGWTPRTMLSGFFRKPFDAQDPQIEKVYGGMSAYMTCGFSGYAGGKSFYRVGAGLNLGLHQPRPRSVWWDPNNPARRWAPRAGILHFDGFTRRHWTRKMAQRLKEDGSQKGGHSPGRTRQIAVATGLQAAEIEADRLYDLTRQVSPRKALDLVARGKILPYRFNIAQSLTRVWPEVETEPPASGNRPRVRRDARIKKPGRSPVCLRSKTTYANVLSMPLQASTNPLTALTELSNIACSSLLSVMSTIFSIPFAPIIVGNPTYMPLRPNSPSQ